MASKDDFVKSLLTHPEEGIYPVPSKGWIVAPPADVPSSVKSIHVTGGSLDGTYLELDSAVEWHNKGIQEAVAEMKAKVESLKSLVDEAAKEAGDAYSELAYLMSWVNSMQASAPNLLGTAAVITAMQASAPHLLGIAAVITAMKDTLYNAMSMPNQIHAQSKAAPYMPPKEVGLSELMQMVMVDNPSNSLWVSTHPPGHGGHASGGFKVTSVSTEHSYYHLTTKVMMTIEALAETPNLISPKTKFTWENDVPQSGWYEKVLNPAPVFSTKQLDSLISKVVITEEPLEWHLYPKDHEKASKSGLNPPPKFSPPVKGSGHGVPKPAQEKQDIHNAMLYKHWLKYQKEKPEKAGTGESMKEVMDGTITPAMPPVTLAQKWVPDGFQLVKTVGGPDRIVPLTEAAYDAVPKGTESTQPQAAKED